jgi:hypothetical protein
LDVELELRYSYTDETDSSEEEHVSPYLEIRGVYFTDDASSESETLNFVKNLDSVLSAIEQECELEGESTPLYQSEEDVEGSPFRLKIVFVLMANLAELTDNGDANPHNPNADPVNQDKAVNNQTDTPQDPAPH